MGAATKKSPRTYREAKTVALGQCRSHSNGWARATNRSSPNLILLPLGPSRHSDRALGAPLSLGAGGNTSGSDTDLMSEFSARYFGTRYDGFCFRQCREPPLNLKMFVSGNYLALRRLCPHPRKRTFKCQKWTSRVRHISLGSLALAPVDRTTDAVRVQ